MTDAIIKRSDDAEVTLRRLELRQQWVTGALEEAGRRLHHIMVDHAEVIVTEHLRPVHERIGERVREIAPTLGGVDPDDVSTFGDDPERLAAYSELRKLNKRQGELYSARFHLGFFLGNPVEDTRGEFGWLKNLVAVYGDHWAGRHQTDIRPWPSTPVAKLIWTWTSEPAPQPWLPLPGEQDEQLVAVRKPWATIWAGREIEIPMEQPWQ